MLYKKIFNRVKIKTKYNTNNAADYQLWSTRVGRWFMVGPLYGDKFFGLLIPKQKGKINKPQV